MSKYKKYISGIDEQARALFKEYLKAQDNYKKAERDCKQYPPKQFPSPEYSVKYTRAQADFSEAKYQLRKVKEQLNELADRSKKVRAELVTALEKDDVVNPDDVDGSTMELLKSGILTPSDYSALLNRHSGNSTMTRMISKYIKEKAKTETDVRTRSELQVLASNTRTDTSNRLADFDTVVYTLERTVNNPAMISHWDNLTSGIVENF